MIFKGIKFHEKCFLILTNTETEHEFLYKE